MRTCGSEVGAHLALSSSSSSWWMPRVSLAVACLLSFVSVSILYIKLNVYSASLRVCVPHHLDIIMRQTGTPLKVDAGPCACVQFRSLGPTNDRVARSHWIERAREILRKHVTTINTCSHVLKVRWWWYWFAPGKSISGWDYLLMESPK